MNPLNFRLRYFLATLFAALVAAAALRHVVHVYGGLSREEIRTEALIAIPIIALALILFRRKRQR
jgi:hypothetical protein